MEMERCIKGCGKTTSIMEKDSTHFQMVQYTRESGRITLCMAVDSSLMGMARSGKGSTVAGNTRPKTKLSSSKKGNLCSRRTKFRQRFEDSSTQFWKHWQRVIKKPSSKT